MVYIDRPIQSGEETSLSYFIEICLAINIQPKDVLDFNVGFKPRFSLSSTRKEKTRLTSRIIESINQGFFKEPRHNSEVVIKLKEDFGVVSSSSNVSAILRRLVDDGSLEIIKVHNRNQYFKK